MGLGDKMLKGVLWSAVERFSTRAIQFILGIILARILTPDEYGLIGILLVFTTLSQVFIDSGFTKALIQKKDRTADDISTVFFFNIGISIFCYAILWVTAPYIAVFYKNILLESLLRVLALSLIFNALFTVPTTLFTIDLNFKTLTIINTISALISGLLAIYLAYDGFGVWALVYQSLARSVSMAILMWLVVKWRPKLVFSKASFKGFFAYGSNLLASSLLNRIVNDLSTLFIGKYLSAAALGNYSRGVQFVDFMSSTVNNLINRVLLPGLTAVQDQIDRLIAYIRKIIKITALVMVPLFLGLLVLADPLVHVLLTDKWAAAIPIMQIFCVARLITIISGVNINLLYIIGRTDLVLRQQIVKLVVRIIFVLIALKYGIIYIALAELISTIIHFFINTYHPGKIMGYGAFSQIKDITVILINGVVMMGVVYASIYFIEDNILKLVVGTLIGGVSYFFQIKWTQKQEMDFLLSKLKRLKEKNENHKPII